MRIERRFTKAGESPWTGVIFEQRSSVIRNPDGEAVFAMDPVFVPDFWSGLATDIIAQKYFRKAGVPARLKRIPEEGVPEWLQCSEADEKALTNLAPEMRFTHENDVRQIVGRMAGTWTYWAWKGRYFDSEEDALAFHDELVYMLAHQMCAPNSPQWFNTGLHWAYGINGPAQGHYYIDHKSGEVRPSEDAYTHPQPHACFIQSIEDDLVGADGIMDLWTREARLFKYGSGTGTNFSSIRAEGEPLSGGGRSSGLMSFLRIGDRSAGAIKSGGTTRRAAKMVILDLDHPEIENFIKWKTIEEQKVAALVAGSRLLHDTMQRIVAACGLVLNADAADPRKNQQLAEALLDARRRHVPESWLMRALQLVAEGRGDAEIPVYDIDFNSEAYATVSGQNSNNSVRVPNAFMRSLENDGEWALYARGRRASAQSASAQSASGVVGTDAGNAADGVMRTIKTRKLWDDIAHAAWAGGEPGIQYHTTINEWHTCPLDGEIKASNPCSEYMFLDDTACNLASLNLIRFYDAEKSAFNADDFEHAVRLWTLVLDVSVLMAQYPSKKMAELSWRFRTLGLGYANIGGLVMVMGLPYDSPEARALAAVLAAMMHFGAYAASAEIAGELGAFPGFAKNREHMLRVMRNHRAAVYNQDENAYTGLSILPQGIEAAHAPADLLRRAQVSADCALRLGEENGYRNAQVTVIAPTGTIGLVMDCDTTGIEPDYALVKYKKLSGGGYFRITNRSFTLALRRLGYSDKQIEDIDFYVRGRGTLKGCPAVTYEGLLAKGFDKDTLAKIETLLPTAFDISFVFNPIALGEQFCRAKLGIDAAMLEAAKGNVLTALGFSREEVEAVNDWVCGTMMLEGAPHLNPAHLAVFDTSSCCGKRGTRVIRPEGHMLMMAAVQPFISGAISKTVNLPHTATIGTIKQVYENSWKLSLKAVAVYRDGSKLSQPLNATAESPLFEELEEGMRANANTHQQIISLGEQLARGVGQQSVRQAGVRNKLPDRRKGGYTQKARIGGHSLYLHTGEYENGQLGEIFIDMHREGAAFRSLVNSFAIAVSLGLQFGVPLEEFVEAFVFTRFEPNGMVMGHDHIKTSTSVVDFIFRDLAITYLERYDLAHIAPDEEKLQTTDISGPQSRVSFDVPAAEMRILSDETLAEGAMHKAMAQSEVKRQARIQGFTGDLCSDCGSPNMVRNGTCLQCEACGTTSGCS
jgi:ribonucleoside-diphosphate reductase alpha chain